MRGTIVFSPLNDVIFLTCDESFKEFVILKAKKDGLVAHNSERETALDSNIVLQIFSPLVNSYNFMKSQIGNQYHVIECENGLKFILNQFADYVYLTINGDGTESEQLLQKKIAILYRILTFLYGPAIEEVHSEVSSNRKRNWLLVDRLLHTWCTLYLSEQGFLLEALERLFVNQQLSAECVSHLEDTLEAFHNADDHGAMHAMILVNTKLLALYSSKKAQELSSADVLLTTLLVNAAFPPSQTLQLPASPPLKRIHRGFTAVGQSLNIYQTLKDPSKSKPRTSSLSENLSDAKVSSDSCSNQRINSPCSATTSSSSDSEQQGINCNSPYPRIFSETENTTRDSENGLTTLLGQHSHKPHQDSVRGESTPGAHGKEDQRDLEMPFQTESDLSLDEDDSADKHPDTHDVLQSPVSKYKRVVVMLRNAVCSYVPHMAHCVQVLPGVILVVLSELYKPSHATLLESLIAHVNQIQHHKEKEDISIILEKISSIDHILRNLSDVSKQFKGKGKIAHLLHNMSTRWDAFKQSDVFMEMKSHKGPVQVLPPRLESTLHSLLEQSKELFRTLYLTPKYVTNSALEEVIANTGERLYHYLLDYKDYLSIKCQRNVTINTYLEDFPGLVHFVYIDRSTDQMIAPTLSSISQLKAENNDISNIMKNNLHDFVWRSVFWIQKKLCDGCISILARESDFIISYFIWFEDPMGNRLSLREPFKNESCTTPGILTSNFYKKMQHDCFQGSSSNQAICCYELLCIHIGILPSNYILAHCRKLAASLWETSGASKSPLPFL